MAIISGGCLGAQTLKLYKPQLLPPPIKTLTLTLNPSPKPQRFLQSPRFPYIIRAFSSPAAQIAATPVEKVKDAAFSKPQPHWRAAIDFKWIRENRDLVAANIKNRNSTANLELVLELYDRFLGVQKNWRSNLFHGRRVQSKSASSLRGWQEVERIRGERNVVANKMKGKLDPSVRQSLVEEGKNLKEQLVTLEEDLAQLTDMLQVEAQSIPNISHPDVPIGGEESSTLRKMVGSQKEFNFAVRDHLQLGKELDLFDFDAAAEVSGSKFYYLKNNAVLLEMALVNWAVSEVSRRGFTPLCPPEIVRSSIVEKCGFQPRGQNTQVYSIEGTDQCLIGTSEIPVAGIHMDSILPESQLPLKYVAYSHCFRTEAGAAGAATRGLYRVHQFSKVEMFIFCRPEDSDMYHDELIGIEEELFTSLGLHFKTLDMATGDLGAPAYRKFDIEAWMPGLGRYGEISSASNCTDYQSRRLGIRYRPSSSSDPLAAAAAGPKKGKGLNSASPTRFVHTLNATACAVPRMIICLLENFQQEDGSVLIPEPIRPFMGGLKILSPKGH